MTVDIEDIIRGSIPKWDMGNGKQGKSEVQGAVCNALRKAGYCVDVEDTREFLRSGMQIWQRYLSNGFAPESTKRRRLIDLVVYTPDGRTPQALIEIESDLAHMGERINRLHEKCYAVASFARDISGRPFDSYNSIERMAAAAQYWAIKEQDGGRYPTPEEGVERLREICSDLPEVHNPGRIGLFLVVHSAKAQHCNLLQRRLDSLGMKLIVGTLQR